MSRGVIVVEAAGAVYPITVDPMIVNDRSGKVANNP